LRPATGHACHFERSRGIYGFINHTNGQITDEKLEVPIRAKRALRRQFSSNMSRLKSGVHAGGVKSHIPGDNVALDND